MLSAGVCDSRVYLELASADLADKAALAALGVRAVAQPAPDSLHLLLGPRAAAVARALA